MVKAVAVAAVESPTLAESVRDALRSRIGDERFGVWFGEATWSVQGTAGERQVVIQAGQGVTHEWLRSTFRGELETVVRESFGPGLSVVWEPAVAGADVVRPTGRLDEPNSDVTLRVVSAPRKKSPPRAAAPAGNGSRRPALQLDDFVLGSTNRMALAAIEMAVSRLGELSPLVIHGPSGVGKTHLLEAACSRCRELHPEKSAVFLSG